jgi:hypothetical protein
MGSGGRSLTVELPKELLEVLEEERLRRERQQPGVAVALEDLVREMLAKAVALPPARDGDDTE